VPAASQVFPGRCGGVHRDATGQRGSAVRAAGVRSVSGVALPPTRRASAARASSPGGPSQENVSTSVPGRGTSCLPVQPVPAVAEGDAHAGVPANHPYRDGSVAPAFTHKRPGEHRPAPARPGTRVQKSSAPVLGETGAPRAGKPSDLPGALANISQASRTTPSKPAEEADVALARTTAPLGADRLMSQQINSLQIPYR